MLPHATSGSDPSEPVVSSSEAPVPLPNEEDCSFETDFAGLAARFAAPGGGGLSPELSAELALEIVLNQIVEQACLATGANGAAVVLHRDGEMVCRATTGPTAPALGSRLNTSSGLSGECARTLRSQRCGDVLTDTRADVEASERLGVRSVLVMPLLRGGDLLGFFELFSSRPFAFGDRDERTLEALASRVLANLDRALRPLPQQPDSSDFAEAEVSADNDVDTRPTDHVTLVLAAVVVLCAVLLGVLVGRHLRLPTAVLRTPAGVPSPAVIATSGAGNPPGNPNLPGKVQSTGEAVQPLGSARFGGNSAVASGSLQVFENNKEVFRLSPTAGESTTASVTNEGQVLPASSIEPRKNQPPETVEPPAAGNLLYREEPEYPLAARQQGIQGPVVLDVLIGPAGAVDEVHFVSGPSQLAQAAVTAVKRWRFKPRPQDGQGGRMETRVTVNFRLPQ